MAITTNRHDAPPSLVDFAKAPHYDSGDSDFTVTQLIDSPRISLLRKQHADYIEDDVYENIYRLVGTAIHSIAEKFGNNETLGIVAEERIFLDVDGLRVSGAIDLQRPSPTGSGVIIGDYKFTSVSSLSFQDKWRDQLSLYAYLLEEVKGVRVQGAEVYAVLRDWQWRRAKFDRDYPQTPGVTVQVDLLDRWERKEYFNERLSLHKIAKQLYEEDGRLIRCLPEDRWEGEPAYAVRDDKNDEAAAEKGKRSRAVRVFRDEDDAKELADTKPHYSIEYRPGEAVRCDNFCEVAEFCDQRNT